MKSKTAARFYPLLLIVFAALVVILVSWNDKQPGDQFKQIGQNDTIPREKKIRDLDDALRELDNIELKLDMEKIQKEIAEAMKKIDIDAAKMKLEVEKAMKEVDFDKIKREVEESMAKIDWDKIKKELDQVKNIDMEKLEIDMKKAKEELEKIGPQIKEELEKAKVEIEKAKVELKEYKDFVDGLEKDDLLNKKEDYSIKHKDGELTVNGKKVSDQVYNKYRSFLEKHKNFTIEKNADNFNIDND